MARNEIFISASPRNVFELLSDPRTYAYWVVGSREIRAADGNWPEPGAIFDHSVGARLVRIDDHTRAVSSRAPVMLELRARARPLPTARVAIHLVPEGNGTRVMMVEAPANRLVSLLAGPVGHGLIRIRNVESLKRLKQLAEGTASRPRGRLPRRGARTRRERVTG